MILEVTDEFCPRNAGRWRLRTSPSGASVARTEEPAQLALDVADLAAAYLGGTTLTSLAAAGRVRELVPGALSTASRAFATDRPPSCPDAFRGRGLARPGDVPTLAARTTGTRGQRVLSDDNGSAHGRQR